MSNSHGFLGPGQLHIKGGFVSSQTSLPSISSPLHIADGEILKITQAQFEVLRAQTSIHGPGQIILYGEVTGIDASTVDVSVGVLSTVRSEVMSHGVEGSADVVFLVSRTSPNQALQGVTYTLHGSASSPDDYEDTNNGMVNFDAGESSVEIRISPKEDQKPDPQETLILRLDTPQNTDPYMIDAAFQISVAAISDSQFEIVDLINQSYNSTFVSQSFSGITSEGRLLAWGNSHNGSLLHNLNYDHPDKIMPAQIVSNRFATAVLQLDGSVLTWGTAHRGGYSWHATKGLESGVRRIFANTEAFAALMWTGKVVTFGQVPDDDEFFSANSTSVQDSLYDIENIVSSDFAFAALRSDGVVISWGREQNTVLSDNRHHMQDPRPDNVDRIFSTSGAFAALKKDGTVQVWGNYLGGTPPTTELIDIVDITSNRNGFAALTASGNVIAWGDGVGYLRTERDVARVFATERAFAAIRTNGTVIGWGQSKYGGSQAPSSLENVVDIVPNKYGFAALTSSGGMTSWGYYTKLNKTIESGVRSVTASRLNFAAILENSDTRSDPHITAWGIWYSSSPDEITNLTDPVQIVGSTYGFTVLKGDGSIVAWEDGTTSSTSSQPSTLIEFDQLQPGETIATLSSSTMSQRRTKFDLASDQTVTIFVDAMEPVEILGQGKVVVKTSSQSTTRIPDHVVISETVAISLGADMIFTEPELNGRHIEGPGKVLVQDNMDLSESNISQCKADLDVSSDTTLILAPTQLLSGSSGLIAGKVSGEGTL